MKKASIWHLKVQRLTGHTESKPPLKAPLACIHPLPNLSFTFLSYVDNPHKFFCLFVCLFVF